MHALKFSPRPPLTCKPSIPWLRMKLGGIVEAMLLERLKQPHSSKHPAYAPGFLSRTPLTCVQTMMKPFKHILRLPPTTDFQTSTRCS